MRRFIPLSTVEAWRLYNEGHCIFTMDNFRSPKYIVPEGKTKEFFEAQMGKTCWGLVLTKEDNEFMEKAYRKRTRRTIGSVLGLSIGGIFLILAFTEIPSTRFTPLELFTYGTVFSLTGVACLVQMLRSFNKEKVSWERLFAKYDTWDYYKS